jgi:hypothetical protein
MLPHDSQGFLIGEVIPEIRRAADLLTRIRSDIAAIKRGVLAGHGARSSGALGPQGNRSSRRGSGSRSDTASPRLRSRHAGSSGPGQSGAPAGSGPSTAGSVSPRRRMATNPAGPSSENQPPLPPIGNANAQSGQQTAHPPLLPAGDESASSRPRRRPPQQPQRERDAHGRFTSNNEGEQRQEQTQRRLFDGMADRLAEAVTGSASGIEAVDPAIQAFNEVAQPLARGYQLFAGGDKETRWYKRLFGELRLFRKEQSTFNRAEQRTLNEIDTNIENTGGGNAGNQSFLGGLLGGITPFIMTALTRIGGSMVTGATALLGTIFGPIGLAIGGLATAAWGLFTEDGRKFFANVADKIYLGWEATSDYLKGKWDEGVKAFADLWEPIAKFFGDKFGIVSEAAKSAVNTVADTADKANEFVKDKTGVDVKEGIQSAAGAVKTAYEKAVDATSRNVVEPTADFFKSSTESVRAVPKKLSERWQEAKQYLGNAAIQAGVDPGLLAKIAHFESGFNSEAKPVRKRDGKVLSSAHGYGQFLDDTWVEMVRKHGTKYGIENAGTLSKVEALKLRSNKDLQAALLAEFTKGNIEKGRQLGGSNDDANVYALHNLGAGDGQKFLKALRKNPNARVGDILSQKVIKGNQSLYGNGDITLSEAYERMSAAMLRGETFAREIRLPSMASVQAQTVSAPSPAVPSIPKPQAVPEAPKVMVPLAGDSRKTLSVTIDKGDIGQDLSDRRLAHIVTGGLSAGA